MSRSISNMTLKTSFAFASSIALTPKTSGHDRASSRLSTRTAQPFTPRARNTRFHVALSAEGPGVSSDMNDTKPNKPQGWKEPEPLSKAAIAELTNGRAAMIGFFAALLVELYSGVTINEQVSMVLGSVYSQFALFFNILNDIIAFETHK